jgi:hypothetical protein
MLHGEDFTPGRVSQSNNCVRRMRGIFSNATAAGMPALTNAFALSTKRLGWARETYSLAR